VIAALLDQNDKSPDNSEVKETEISGVSDDSYEDKEFKPVESENSSTDISVSSK
jgi:hypothetical protein